MIRLLVAVFFFLSIFESPTAQGADALTVPTLSFQWESPAGSLLYVQLNDSDFDFLRQKVKDFRYVCTSSSGSCVVDSPSFAPGVVRANILVSNYSQGKDLRIAITKSLDVFDAFNPNSLMRTSSTRTSKSFETLKPLQRPIRGPITQEIGGCSFDILNYDERNDYFFKIANYKISENGHARFFLPQGISSQWNYISVTRKNGYVIINAVDTLHECKPL